MRTDCNWFCADYTFDVSAGSLASPVAVIIAFVRSPIKSAAVPTTSPLVALVQSNHRCQRAGWSLAALEASRENGTREACWFA
jgi:hypothetical protein